MSVFDSNINQLIQRHIHREKVQLDELEKSREKKLAALDKELSMEIAKVKGKIEMLEQMDQLNWKHYAKTHLENAG